MENELFTGKWVAIYRTKVNARMASWLGTQQRLADPIINVIILKLYILDGTGLSALEINTIFYPNYVNDNH